MKNILETHEKYKNGTLSPVEVTKQCLAIAEKNENNAYISVVADIAIEQAKTSEQRYKSGKSLSVLDGIPYSLKDLFVTKGIRTTAGSLHLANYIPPYDGHVASSLASKGGILVGKVGCDEFGMGSTNENTPFGVVKYPGKKDYVAGGSSGGSASAVLEGSCFFSVGTDTGGSIRLPANFCGLTGYKPSYGKVSRYGQIAYASSLDQASPIAHQLLDVACVMEAISGRDPRDSTQVFNDDSGLVQRIGTNSKIENLKKITIGYDPSFIAGCNPGVKKALEEALAKLKDCGVSLKEISLPHLKYSVAVYYLIATAEACANLSRYDGIHYGYRSQESNNLEDLYMRSRVESLGEEVKKRIMLGTFALSSGYSDQYFQKACKVRALIARDFEKSFETCDFIFSPVCASSALKEKKFRQNSNPLEMYMNDLYTIPVNLAGLPGVAIPCGQDNGMPTGFQLIGKQFQDEALLTFANTVEKALV